MARLRRGISLGVIFALITAIPGPGFYQAAAAERASGVRFEPARRSAAGAAIEPIPLELGGDLSRGVEAPLPAQGPLVEGDIVAGLGVEAAAAQIRSAPFIKVDPQAGGRERRASVRDLQAAVKSGIEVPIGDLPRTAEGADAVVVSESLDRGSGLSRELAAPIDSARAPPSPRAAGARHRWAGFPAVLAGVLSGIALTVWVLREAAAWYAFRALSEGAASGLSPVLTAFDVLSLTGLSLALLASVWAFGEIRAIRKMAREPGVVSDAEFRRAADQAIDQLGLPPEIRQRFAELVKPYRGEDLGLSYGFSARGGIYAQPWLARYPSRFVRFLKHEADHYFKDKVWAPYRHGRGRLLNSWLYFTSELRAHVFENLPAGMQSRQLPTLERILRKARYSLDLPGRYELLLLESASRSNDWADHGLYNALSAGKAKVVPMDPESGSGPGPSTAKVATYLNNRPATGGRFRVIVTAGEHVRAPEAGEPGGDRLRLALENLERIRRVADSLRDPQAAADIRDPGTRKAVDDIRRRVQKGVSREAAVEEVLSDLWRQKAKDELGDVHLVQALNGFYNRLQDRGPVIIHWDRPSPDVETMARLMQYWRGDDKGRFEVVRVQVDGGGEALVAFKNEPRAELWLEARPGKRLEETSTRLHLQDNPAEAARQALIQAGYSGPQVKRFLEDMDMEVKHVFGHRITNRGPPFEMNHIFVTVPRRYVQALKRYAETEGFPVRASRGGIRAHMVQSLPIQKVGFLHKWFGIRGKGLNLDSLDTGVDDTHSDFATKEEKIRAKAYTNQPPTVDYEKHGSFTFSEMVGVRGAAPEAGGVMRAVFSREGGASDGDIMAALTDAYKDGADGINLSLGQDGEVGSPLAVFVSNLVSGQKNSNGESVFIVVSYGNSGPLDMTGGEPATGEHALGVAAATKSLDDGVPEVAWYSSRGFALDSRWYVPRVVFKPEGVPIGGDVTDGKDMFAAGVQAAKSKYGEPSSSDSADGSDTRMSGTSMAAPFMTAIMGLVKHVLKSLIKLDKRAQEFFMEHLPYSLKAILMRSAKDMGAPLVAQGPGLVDALGAVMMAVKTFGTAKDVEAIRKLARKAGAPESELAAADAASAGEAGFAWIQRLKRLADLELKAYHAAKEAGDAVKKRGEAANPNPGKAEKEKIGNEANVAALKRFGAERDAVLPDFVKALKDPVWLVRMYAAFYLMNFNSPEAAENLLEAASKDPDARVRQAAFLALAAASNGKADDGLRKAAVGVGQPADVPLYAAYALLRRGAARGPKAQSPEQEEVFAPVLRALSGSDKRLRESAAWAAGQLAKQISGRGTEALARLVADPAERNHIRHVAAIAMAKIAYAANPAVITDDAFLSVLRGAAEDSVLAMDAYQFFLVASKKEEIAWRMNQPPWVGPLMTFIERNKSQPADSPLGRLARLFASVLKIKLDDPPPTSAPAGKSQSRFPFRRNAFRGNSAGFR